MEIFFTDDKKRKGRIHGADKVYGYKPHFKKIAKSTGRRATRAATIFLKQGLKNERSHPRGWLYAKNGVLQENNWAF